MEENAPPGELEDSNLEDMLEVASNLESNCCKEALLAPTGLPSWLHKISNVLNSVFVFVFVFVFV